MEKNEIYGEKWRKMEKNGELFKDKKITIILQH
jgi:hypothetical protein